MVDDRTLERWLPGSVVALTGDLIRALLWMLVVVGLVSCGRIYLRLALLTYDRPGGNDFTIFYYTARMVRDGWPMYGQLPAGYDVSWHRPFLGNLNPPQFQLLLAPLVPLGYRGAVVAWILLSLLAVAWTAWLIVSELTRAMKPRTTLVTLLAVFGSIAWTSVAVTAEMSALLRCRSQPRGGLRATAVTRLRAFFSACVRVSNCSCSPLLSGSSWSGHGGASQA